MTISTGTRIGRYEIRSQIGAGGMGKVYLAHDTELDRKVAIKILPEHLASDPHRVQRFIQEAKSASALNHPHILTIHEIGVMGTSRFIATEFIDGNTLRQRINSEMTLSEILEVAIQAGSALVAAHEAGIIHRDIKPENIMIRRDGYVKVLDFGLAKLTQPEGVPIDPDASTRALVNTSEGAVMGTATYMSPEQAKGTNVDARTDLWSLGAVLYEMIAGRAPFVGQSQTETLSLIIQKDPAPLTRFAKEVPDELQRIVNKLLTKDRDQRYQSAKDLLIDLRTLKRRLVLEAEVNRTGPSVPSTALGAEKLETQSSAEYVVSQIKHHKIAVLCGLLIVGAAAIGLTIYFRGRNTSNTIDSIAVLPFVNASENAELEYLSDGLTESLINSLNKLPHLSVKARSSVFRYKGKDVDPQQVASQLSVQAVLNGRVTQRGDDLMLSLWLVDGRNGNQLWGERYNRKLSDLLALQSEIARDVSTKLRARLSGADQQMLAKNYTSNTEAAQLYMLGRHHALKRTLPETQKAISYLQQAIALDPSYALAYAGLADAYSSALAADLPTNQFLPQARAAAQKAIEIDDTLAVAHAELGFIVFWDWDWVASENQFKRALELDPDSAETHLYYAHLLSNTGRDVEALAEAKHARELDLLNPRTSALEAQFLIHAGRTDEALTRLREILELDSNYFLAHLYASSAYIEKGMYAEAISEARRAREISGARSFYVEAFLGYALAKSGKEAEARSVLEGLLKSSADRRAPFYEVALVYNGLGRRDEAIAWLERGYNQRDPAMVFLKVEPKWKNLHDDPRFVDLLRRVGLTS